MNAIYRTLAVLPGNWVKGARIDHGKGCGLALLNDNMEPEWQAWADYRNMLAATALEMFPDRIKEPLMNDLNFIDFNDHPDTTQDDVIAVMEKAAVKYDELYS